MHRWHLLQVHWQDFCQNWGAFCTVAQSPFSKSIIEIALISIVSATISGYAMSARLEERIASLVVRIEACERQIQTSITQTLNERERIAQCEARLADLQGKR